jgi:hypothetical protein
MDFELSANIKFTGSTIVFLANVRIGSKTMKSKRSIARTRIDIKKIFLARLITGTV